MEIINERYFKTVAFGDIAKSKFFISAEWHTFPSHSPWRVFFGKTYNGTRAGVVISLGRLIILAHTR